MRKNDFPKSIQAKRVYLALICFIPLFIVTCKNHEKRVQRDRLDNQISGLTKQIDETRDFHTARVPDKFRNIQTKYINTVDSLNNTLCNVDSCINANDSLISHAFNNYAMRIGRNFQLSRFFSKSDIELFQRQIAVLDSGTFVYEMARQRILHNTGSIHDLSYFIEMMDIDSMNTQLKNTLDWNFYPCTLSDDPDSYEISVLEFNNKKINDALHEEIHLLNNAWKFVQKQSDTQDSLYNDDANSAHNARTTNEQDSLKAQIFDYFDENTKITPNFDIPEFDSVRTQYAHNDSIIKQYESVFNRMTDAEDSLKRYRQSIIQKRDSLVIKRNELAR